MTLRLLTEKEYEVALESFSNISFMQSVEMARLLSIRGSDIHHFSYEVDGDIKVLAQSFSNKVAGGIRIEINSGPIYKEYKYLKDFYKDLRSFVKTLNCIELVIKPDDNIEEYSSLGEQTVEKKEYFIKDLLDLNYEHEGLTTGYPNGEVFWHYVKDLEGITQEKLISTFYSKGKSLAKKTATFGINIRALKKEELSIFKEITESTSSRREYKDKQLSYYEDFYDSFADKCEFLVASINFKVYLENLINEQNKLSEEILVLEKELEENPNSYKKKNQISITQKQRDSFDLRISEAKEFIEKYGQEDIVMAASLFIYYNDTTTYLFSGSNTEFNKFYAPVALQEYSMRKSIDLGIKTYNFLGIQGVFDGSDGVLRYKQNFNGYIVRKPGVFKYYPNKFKYRSIKLLKKVLGR